MCLLQCHLYPDTNQQSRHLHRFPHFPTQSIHFAQSLNQAAECVVCKRHLEVFIYLFFLPITHHCYNADRSVRYFEGSQEAACANGVRADWSAVRLLAVSLQALKHKTFPGNEFWEASRVPSELSCFLRRSLLIAELHSAAVTADRRPGPSSQDIKKSQSWIGCFHFHPRILKT